MGGKKEKRFFWQYNTQAKGPKGKRLCKNVDTHDPHVLNTFEVLPKMFRFQKVILFHVTPRTHVYQNRSLTYFINFIQTFKICDNVIDLVILNKRIYCNVEFLVGNNSINIYHVDCQIK